MSLFMLFIVLLLGTFAVVVYLIEPSKTDKAIQERLALLESVGALPLTDEDEIVKHTAFSTVPWIDEYLRRNAVAVTLQRMLEQAGTSWSVGRFIFASLFCAAIGVLIGGAWNIGIWLRWIPGIFLGTIPAIYLYRRRAARLSKFGKFLPDAIDLMTRGLRAGHALPSTIEMLGAELPDPIGPEFMKAAHEQKLGLPFREAMVNLTRRVPLRDLQVLVAALLLQKDSGGNMIDVLERTAAVLRSRQRLQAQVRVHTAQGRLTGLILCALPVICFVLLSIVNRGYVGVLWDDPLGHRMLGAAVVMMTVGTLLIRKITNVRV